MNSGSFQYKRLYPLRNSPMPSNKGPGAVLILQPGSHSHGTPKQPSTAHSKRGFSKLGTLTLYLLSKLESCGQVYPGITAGPGTAGVGAGAEVSCHMPSQEAFSTWFSSSGHKQNSHQNAHSASTSCRDAMQMIAAKGSALGQPRLWVWDINQQLTEQQGVAA